MKKFLFIAEKPSAMREFRETYNKHKNEIVSHLGAEVDFIALRGHIFRNLEAREYEKWNKKWKELYAEDLPMVPEKWALGDIESAKDAIKSLKDTLKNTKYDGIIVGTDSDVEGYGIYYMVMKRLGLEQYKTLRFYETALTDRDILNSFLSMEDLNSPRHRSAVNAFVFRSRWDWLIGMNLSVAYTVRYGQMMRVGSVKAPTLKIIYDNCQAIDNFTESVSYAIQSEYSDGFNGIIINDDNDKDRIWDQKEQAEKVVATLSNQAKVISYKKTTVENKPAKLYSLSDLQIDAAKAPYGYTPDQTLATAQSLYETWKILSYPRTSGNYLSSGKIGDFDDILESIKGVPDLKSFVENIQPADRKRVDTDKNIVNDAEVSKAAHDALVPTGHEVDWNALSKAEKDIFMLVCKRFIAHFMPRFTEEKYVLIADNNGNRVKSNGRKTLVNGFNDIYGKTVDDSVIPEYHQNDILNITKNSLVERKSTPPKRYSVGSIIDAMKHIASYVEDPELKKVMKESEGIGTEATRAGIITELIDSNYITTKKNMIYITDEGKDYIESIRTKTEDGYDYGIADPDVV